MAQTTGIDDFGDLLLHVYRVAHEQPMDGFHSASLDALRRVLPFDSSVWGAGSTSALGFDIHTLHLDRQPPDMRADYEPVKHLDTASAQVVGARSITLGFDTAAAYGASHQKAMKEYCERFDLRHFFITSSLNPSNGLTQWITLFRSRADGYGTEKERRLLAAVAPHLQQAMSYNRLRHLQAWASEGEGVSFNAEGREAQPRRAQAVADLRGVIYHATPTFESLLRAEWSTLPDARLPRALMQCFATGRSRFVGCTLAARCRVERELLFVNARTLCAADRLTPCEWQIAWLLARGDSHKEIARRLDRAPATVRNHIQAIYRRLGVGSVAALIAELHAALD